MNRVRNSRFARVVAAVSIAAGMVLAGSASALAQDDVQPNVIGGTPPTQDYPAGAKVSLQYDAPEFNRFAWHTCGARKFSGRKIVTAAHCVTTPPASMSKAEVEAKARLLRLDVNSAVIPTEKKSFFVRVGSDNKDSGGTLANVTKIEVHPQWSWYWNEGVPQADIAVLTLDTYVDGYDLPIAPREARPGDEVFRLGWGVTELSGEGPLPSQIRELRSKVLDKSQCEPKSPFGWTPGDICINNPGGVNGACSGDSGGPVVIKINGTFYDAGITSRSVADYCGVKPDSYTSTPYYQKWVYDTARGVPVQTVKKDPEFTLPYEPGTAPAGA